MHKPAGVGHPVHMGKTGGLCPGSFVLQKYPCRFVMDTPLVEFSRWNKSLLGDQTMQSCGIDWMFCKNKDLVQRRINLAPEIVTKREEPGIKVVNITYFDFGPVYFKFRSEFFKDGFLHDL